MHHHVIRKKRGKRPGLKKFLHYAMIPATFAGPLMTLPQIYTVWIDKSVQGVSFTTWAGFTVIASVWVLYGISERDYPIIINNILWVIVQAMVAIGVLLYR